MNHFQCFVVWLICQTFVSKSQEPVLKEIQNVELNKKNMDQIPSDL